MFDIYAFNLISIYQECFYSAGDIRLTLTNTSLGRMKDISMLKNPILSYLRHKSAYSFFSFKNQAVKGVSIIYCVVSFK